MSQPLFLTAAKIEGIHGLRGLAAVGIVLFHQQAIPGLPLPAWLGNPVSHLYLSVLFFFALSAYTIAHSAQFAPTPYSAYLLKRFFRIAPLFYVLIAWNLTRAVPDIGTLAVNFTFLFNLFPGREQSIVWAGWSVGVEMIAYMLLPAMLITMRNTWAAFAGFVVTSILAWTIWRVFYGLPNVPTNYSYFFFASNLMAFVAGILAYRLYTEAFRPSLAALGATALLSIMYFDLLKLHYPHPGLYFAGWAAGFALLCVWQSQMPSVVLRSRLFQWLGDRSFSIYLLHPIVIELNRHNFQAIQQLALGHFETYLLSLAVTLPILFALAEVTYALIERPGMRIGREAISVLQKAQRRRDAGERDSEQKAHDIR